MANIEITTTSLYDQIILLTIAKSFLPDLEIDLLNIDRLARIKKTSTQFEIGLIQEFSIDVPISQEEGLKKLILYTIQNLDKEIARSIKILSNQNFITKADPQKVEEEKSKFKENAHELATYIDVAFAFQWLKI